jgi:hypothetical protein
MTGATGCNCNNRVIGEDITYITPNMWNLYNVNQDVSTSTATRTIPIFHNTYVGRAKHHYANDRLEYRKCNNYTGNKCNTCSAGCTDGVPIAQFGETKKVAYSMGIQKNAKCISGPACTGRCEIVCNTIPQVQQKQNIAKHDSNYIGTSKKMAYGKYVRTTPGMETFASKKVVALQPLVTKNQECWTDYLCRHI